MAKGKLYFRSVDDNICYSLQKHIEDAKDEGLTKITLIEAIADNSTNDYVWCNDYGDVGEKSLCNKANCPSYTSKSGRGKCEHRGKLYLHGEKVVFEVKNVK
jgi:meiotically up-regulated gene 157 (Mug157) protein